MRQSLIFYFISNCLRSKVYLTSVLLLVLIAIVPTRLSAQIEVRTKLYLQGPYNSGLNRHKDVTASWVTILQNNATTQPYNVAPFNYAGTESIAPAIFAATAATTDIVDWVLVELKNAGGALVEKRAGFVLENGDVVDIDGSSPLEFNAPAGSYYITVRHRNHLSLSTQQMVALSASPGAYDFDFTTATDAQLYGTSTAFSTSGSNTLLVAGDVNANSNVRYNGPANDRDVILGYLGGNETGIINNVYRAEDVNLDGIVRYNGPANDRDALLNALDGNEIGLKTSSEITLPVTWGTITAVIKNNQLVVNWVTESETNNNAFIIEGSLNGNEWYELGTVNTKNGNCATPQQYNFTTSSSGIILGLSFAIFTLLNFGYNRKKVQKSIIVILFLSGLIIFSSSCNKNNNVDIPSVESVHKFIRIAQIDIDGTKKYSKVIKVVID